MADLQILLYYKYTPIEHPEKFRQEHYKLCTDLNLKGRILVSEEGINGTLSGSIEDTQRYMDFMDADQRFAGINFKIDPAEEHPFKKLHVRYRPEIVSLNLNEEDVDPRTEGGDYLSPVEFRKALEDENTIVLDARNDYEYDLGHFRGAVRPEIRNFRELPEWIRENKEKFMDKKIVTYCTGGVRCEKLTGWLLKEGYEDVAQLHNGIHAYGTDPDTQGELWDGQMYVFDGRISVPVNRKEHVIVGKDWFDGTPCERYVNCGNPDCNRQILCSIENEDRYLRGCSHECRVHPRNRYVTGNKLSEQEVIQRLNVIGESHPFLIQ